MYLTEERLGDYLEILFPNTQFIHNKAVPNSGLTRARPDYRSEKLKLIIEFDGYQHYNSASVILNDNKKDIAYKALDYRVIRIPYFIQMSPNLCKLLGSKKRVAQTYPDGFIDSRALLPADFSSLGLKRFEKDLKTFSYAIPAIRKSLKAKLKENDASLVITTKIKKLLFL